MGITLSEKEKNIVHAGANQLILNNYIIYPALQAKFENSYKDSIGDHIIYNSLEFFLEGEMFIPSENKSQHFDFYDKLDSINQNQKQLLHGGFKKIISNLSQKIAFPNFADRGLLILPNELEAIYMPLLEKINNYAFHNIVN